MMGHLLSRGHREFLLGKYVLTAAGLPFLIVFQHYPLFGTRFRAGWLLHVFGRFCSDAGVSLAANGVLEMNTQ